MGVGETLIIWLCSLGGLGVLGGIGAWFKSKFRKKHDDCGCDCHEEDENEKEIENAENSD